LSNATPQALHSSILPPGSKEDKLSLPQLGHFTAVDFSDEVLVSDCSFLQLTFIDVIENKNKNANNFFII
jgi:hypothetical protein